jgi:hypothetical protein
LSGINNDPAKAKKKLAEPIIAGPIMAQLKQKRILLGQIFGWANQWINHKPSQ